MIEPKPSDIGRGVIYRVHSNAEAGGGFWIGQQAPVARCARSFCMTPIKEFMRRKARKTSPSSAQSALATIRCSKAGCIGRIRLATERIPCLSRC